MGREANFLARCIFLLEAHPESRFLQTATLKTKGLCFDKLLKTRFPDEPLERLTLYLARLLHSDGHSDFRGFWLRGASTFC